MKQIYCLLPLLCHFFSTRVQANVILDTVSNARTNPTIKIGEAVPDRSITGISNLILKGKAVTTARISDFKGQLLIIDFWATWCAPCRAMIPRMDSLQKEFAGRVRFLPVSYESRNVVEPLLKQLHQQFTFNLPDVMGDTVLNRLFPHRALPHYVWIDAQGILRAVTEDVEVNALNIRRMILSTKTALAGKQDVRVAYDNQRPLLIGNNGGTGSGLIYHSLLTHYQEGIGGGLNISTIDSTGQRFTVRNAPLLWLARLAYADGARWFPNSRIRLESRDSLNMTSKLSGQAYAAWLRTGRGWCYELQVPPPMISQAFGIIREDLGRFFPDYKIRVEKRIVSSLVLVRTSALDKIRSKGGAPEVDITPYTCHLRNGNMSALIMRLERQFMQNSKLPITDATAYNRPVDLDLEAPLSDLNALNKALAPYDLSFVQRDYPAELLIISDRILKP